MKLFHLSDLHLGKRLCGVSLLEDQRDMLKQIIWHIRREKPDAVIIAGDIYDRSVPPEEAVALFDDFLFELSELKMSVFIVSGNHDSAERLAYGGRILNRSGIYISPELNRNNYDTILKPITLKDDHGEVNFYLLPFVTPPAVRAARAGRPEAEISSYTDAVRAVIGEMNVDTSKRNVLIAHQYVTGAQTCDSETFSVGGLDNVDGSVFEAFDYTALGHLHGSQNLFGGKIRYCGTPLKYSFSEANHKKSITVLEIGQKGTVGVSEIPLDKPLHELREVKGSFSEVTAGGKSDDYIKVILTDEDEGADMMNKLREYFPNIMQMSFENSRTAAEYVFSSIENVNRLSPLELFSDFYKLRTGSELNERQAEIVKTIFEEIEEGGI